MITCSYMEKSYKEKWLPLLFDLYYENMHRIAPSGLSWGEERSQWLSEVSPALDKEPRQIILCLQDGIVQGYLQYYTRGSLLMIEEIQIRPAFQGTLLFHRMCRYLSRNLPKNIEILEAYADSRNIRSKSIMYRLSFQETGESPFPGLVHFRADAAAVFSRMIQR